MSCSLSPPKSSATMEEYVWGRKRSRIDRPSVPEEKKSRVDYSVMLEHQVAKMNQSLEFCGK